MTALGVVLAIAAAVVVTLLFRPQDLGRSSAAQVREVSSANPTRLADPATGSSTTGHVPATRPAPATEVTVPELPANLSSPEALATLATGGVLATTRGTARPPGVPHSTVGAPSTTPPADDSRSAPAGTRATPAPSAPVILVVPGGERPSAPANSRQRATTTISSPAKSPPLVPVPAQYLHPLGWIAGDKVVSLTFDDGPSPYTGRVLDLLARYRIKATFCQIGEQVGSYPAIEARIAADGHTLCDHTWTHDEMLANRSVAVIDSEIGRTQQAIRTMAGVTPRYYRAPGGEWGKTSVLRRELARFRTIPLAWADDSLDWTTPGVTKIVDNVISTVTPGSIILMHDGGGRRSQTLAALPKIIVALRAAGYHFVVLPPDPPG